MIFNMVGGSIAKKILPVLDENYPEDASVQVNGSITSTVAISVDGNPAKYTYQWYKDGVVVTGEVSETYTFMPDNAGTTTVYCEVTNSAGTVTSRVATITVTEATVYLMNGGDTCDSVTGGWVTTALKKSPSEAGVGKPTLTVNESNISLQSAQEAYAGGIVRTVNKIDLTNFGTLTFNGSGSSEICVWSSIGSYWKENQEAYVNVADGATVDVSGLTGSYYIGFGMRTSSDAITTRQSVTVTSLRLS